MDFRRARPRARNLERCGEGVIDFALVFARCLSSSLSSTPPRTTPSRSLSFSYFDTPAPPSRSLTPFSLHDAASLRASSPAPPAFPTTSARHFLRATRTAIPFAGTPDPGAPVGGTTAPMGWSAHGGALVFGRATRVHVKTLGADVGESTADGRFYLREFECLGACANAPVLWVDDDFYEDLTPETTKQLLVALKEAALKTGAGGNAPGLAGDAGKDEVAGQSTGQRIKLGGEGYTAQGVSIPSPGPLSSRTSCEPAAGQTTLLSEPLTGEQMLRKDGAF